MSENQAKGPGQLLIEARTIAGYSPADIAERLNLSESVVEQLESDHYSSNIPDAFIRGYLRTYARLVGQDESEIIELYSHMTGNTAVQSNYIPSKDVPPVNVQIGSHLLWFKLLSLAVVIVILGFGWMAYSQKNVSDELTQPITQPNTQSNQLFEAKNITETVKPNKDNLTSSGSLAKSTEKTASKAVDNQEPSSINLQQTELESTEFTDSSQDSNQQYKTDFVEPESVEMELTFIEDCWIKITDFNGDVLAVGLKQAGRRFTISGIPPVKVVLGKPRAVALQYDNQSVDLSIYPAGQSARFTLGN